MTGKAWSGDIMHRSYVSSDVGAPASLLHTPLAHTGDNMTGQPENRCLQLFYTG